MSDSNPRLQRSPSGQLEILAEDGPKAVRVQPCFPMSAPERFYSLLDEEGTELALVREPADLDADSRAALEAAIPDSAFTIEVTGIDSVVVDIDPSLEDNELMLMALGPGPFPDESGCEVPALGLVGTVGLAVLLLGLGARAVRRR